MTNLRSRKTILFQHFAAAIFALLLFPGRTSVAQDGTPTSSEDEIRKQAIELGPGSAHPGTTGEVNLKLEEFMLEGDPHACGIIWDVAVDEKKGELFVLCEPKRVGGVGEVRVFDRSGAYLRTIMPLNPTLPYASVRDITREVVREGGTELIVPKFDLSWGEPSFYGSFWDSHKKIALAPDGDLVISDLYRGKLMRMGPDGSLPEEGWNSGFAVHVSGNKGSAIENYLPFGSLRYPYFHFGPDGSMYVSGGQSSFEAKYHHYNLEGGVNKARYHFPVKGERSSYVWKLGLKPGPEAEKQGVVGGFKEASGIVVDGDYMIVADAGNNRLRVCTLDGKEVASVTHYIDNGQKQPILDPTALAMDRDKCLYVLIGSQERPEDLKTEGSIRFVQNALHASAFEELPPPRKVIKLQSWKTPKLLAESAHVHTHVMQITVDAGVSPPLVWVANGDGPGSLQQLSGADLSLQAQWQDDGSTLSNPRQDSGMPILNIDPETGHVYLEDDARYRHKKFGTVYRLDQQGNILKKWDPYFIDIEESGLISPWGATNLERGFPHPEEPLFLDSVFGKDGRVYRWKLGEEGISILRFDRAGNPVPFASTGKHELLVDAVPIKGRFYEKAHLRKQLTCWWDVYSGMDVDREGNIYYLNKQKRYMEKEMMLPRYALYRQLDVYDSTGKLKQEALLNLTSVKGIQVDQEGYMYIVHIPADGRSPVERIDRAKAKAPKRYPMRSFALSKFAPTGGEPLWSQPWDGDHGMGFIPPNPHCICSTHRVNQALDDKGYIYIATKHSVQVVDTKTGKLVGEFGSYGNADCKGKGSAYPHPELPFGSISSLAVWKDKLFVMDVLNRRLVKLNISYDPTLKTVRAEESSQTSDNSATEPSRPNIVVLLADDMHWQNPGFNGGPVSTPNLDRLAREGSRLTQFYVHSVCSPTRAAFLTGRYPFRNGMEERSHGNDVAGMLTDERTMAGALHDAGYYTAIIGKWHLGNWKKHHLPMQRGFDYQYGIYGALVGYYTKCRERFYDWHRNEQVLREEGYTTDLIAQEASKVIESLDTQKPFFLYIPFTATHGPDEAPKALVDKYRKLDAKQLEGLSPAKREFYARKYAMLDSMDQAVGRILTSLETRGVLDDTLIVFFNDNGGRVENPPFRGGKGETFEGGVRVPCILRWPERVPAGQRVAGMIHVVDLYPTLLGQAGVSLDQPLPLDGLDVWNTITLDQKSPRREVVHSLPGEQVDTGPMSIQQGAYKLVDNALFNIEQDPAEANDLADKHPEIYQSLHQRLLQLVEQRRKSETHTNISQMISEPLLVFGKEENANPPAWLAPYVKSLPPTKRELKRSKSAQSK